MVNLTLSVKNSSGEVLAFVSGEDEIYLVYEPEYVSGDVLSVASDLPDQFLVLQLDDALSPAFVFLKGMSFDCPVPFGEARGVFSERAYIGKRHYLHARLARKDELHQRKNLAFNPYATHAPGGPFPHASANVETRGAMVFAAKNAIDGVKASHFHGEWPFTSWGINQNPQAAWRLDFGRTVALDEAVFYLRADFPHDAWWHSADLHFSDGSNLTVSLAKTPKGQRFSFPQKLVDWVIIDTLLKSDFPSPFPALTQLELFGRDL